MKRAHRKAHRAIWILLPLILLAILWIGFSAHGTDDGLIAAPSVSGDAA
ncbi:hypothetical protein ACFFUB_10960 [Algimonas porphyrae]|nr:hypothetical protein [Algimonas porphyrae]